MFKLLLQPKLFASTGMSADETPQNGEGQSRRARLWTTDLGWQITIRYGLVLLIILTLSTSALGYLEYHLFAAENDSVAVNVSGRQRMLSQQIALYAGIAVHAQTDMRRTEAIDTLHASIDLMEESHQGLTKGRADWQLTTPSPSFARDVYFSGAPSLDSLVTRYIADARVILDNPISMNALSTLYKLETSSAALLSALDSAVQRYETEASDAINFLSIIEIMLWALTLTVLALEVRFVFWPMTRLIEQAIGFAERARRDAEVANEAKSRFVASVSHEFRTPLNAIIGMTSLMREREMDVIARDYTKDLANTADHLLNLVNDILDLSKLGARELVIRPVATRLDRVISGVMVTVRGLAQAKGLEIYLRIPQGLSRRVEIDETRVRQVLINLLENAIKFTDSGSVTLRVELPGEGVLLSVEDTGIGISPEEQHRLFDRFFQAEGAQQGWGDGTGLGLAISYDLVLAMGGTISVDSVPGQGSTFRVHLPVPVTPLGDSADVDQAAQPALEPEPEPLRVLVAEDNPINQKIIEVALRAVECEVVLADTGKVALEKLQSDGAFDMVVVDSQMPDLSGYDTIIAIRQMPGLTGQVPILSLTADADPETQRSMMSAGANDFMTKPFSIPELRSVVRQLADEGRRVAASADRVRMDA